MLLGAAIIVTGCAKQPDDRSAQLERMLTVEATVLGFKKDVDSPTYDKVTKEYQYLHDAVVFQISSPNELKGTTFPILFAKDSTNTQRFTMGDIYRFNIGEPVLDSTSRGVSHAYDSVLRNVRKVDRPSNTVSEPIVTTTSKVQH
jgi:hypothetical protein